MAHTKRIHRAFGHGLRGAVGHRHRERLPHGGVRRHVAVALLDAAVCRHHGFGFVEQRASVLGEFEVAVAIEQKCASAFVLEVAHGLAERLARDEQVFSRLREAATLGGGDEVFQLAYVHDPLLEASFGGAARQRFAEGLRAGSQHSACFFDRF